MGSELQEFKKRKKDHIQMALNKESQYLKTNPLEKIKLKHTAFPELDWSELDSTCYYLEHQLGAPFFISSMTAGHDKGMEINLALAELSAEKKILMGVGSQRRELFDDSAKKEWKKLRKKNPKALLLSNIGLSQLIQTPADKILQIIDNLESIGLIIHTNPLQECIQKEGTPQFKMGLSSIERLVRAVPVPVIVKEVGNGFSEEDRRRLKNTGIYALDLSAKGGTDWSRVEALRFPRNSKERASGFIFSEWGYSLPEMMLDSEKLNLSYETWGSGGIRSGLDIAKVLALGCQKVGLAQPWLEALLKPAAKNGRISECKLNKKALYDFYTQIEKEMKVALFCTGSKNIKELQNKKVMYVAD
ncbi:MAG: type 2 isopentenyl-diphosphate Delta-isomerase [Deltaproteobacteria bacterium]|nr:type 2 isopentenyl-diphosphate Delta-isomerase [Deltaproteobacteria bacterium]